MQNSAIEFYCTLPEATRNNYDDTVKAYQWQHSEKPVVFFGRQVRRVQQAIEKLTNILEAVIRIEEEEQAPRIAAIGKDEAEIPVDSVNYSIPRKQVIG